MPEYSGSLPSFELAAALWLTPLVPLLVAAYALFAGRTLARGPASRTEKKPLDIKRVALGGTLVTFGFVAFHSIVLALLPAPKRLLVSHAWNLVRIGSLDASFTLTLDPGNALIALAVTAAASAILAFAVKRETTKPSFVVGTELALSGALFVLLADDWLLLTLGSALAGLGALVLGMQSAARPAAKSFVIGRLADAILLGAGAVVLWGLGGSWTGAGDYVPDFRARLVGVELGEARTAKDSAELAKSNTGGSASLSMSALPGATLSLGGAPLCVFDADGKPGGVGTNGRACREIARSPFAHVPLAVSLHDFEVTSGPGTNDLSVQKVRLSAGAETLITPSGATLVLREMRAEMAVRDAAGGHPMRAALSTRRIFGLPLLAVVATLLGIAIALRGAIAPLVASLRPSESAEPELAPVLIGLELFVSGAILARTEFLVSLSARVSAVLAALFALVALIAALRAAHALDLRRALFGIGAANLALAAFAFCAGSYVGGVVLLAVFAAAMVGFSLAVTSASEDSELRTAGGARKTHAPLSRSSAWFALALAGAPLPAFGVFFGRDAGIAAAAGIEVLGFVGWVATVAGIFASGFIAFSVWRLHYLVFTGALPRDRKAPDGVGNPVALSLTALAFFALAIGLFGVSKGVLGDALPALLQSWMPVWGDAASATPLDRTVRMGLLGASYFAAITGWTLARSRYRARDNEWADGESARLGHAWLGRPSGAWLEPLIVAPATGAASFLVNLDRAFEKIAFGAPASGVAAESERVSLPAPPPPPTTTPEPVRESEEKDKQEDVEPPKKKKKKKKKRGHP